MTPHAYAKSVEHASSRSLDRLDASDARWEYVKEFVGERLEALLKDCEANMIERREAEEAIGELLRWGKGEK